jgi:DNA replication protein DnaC
MNDNNFNSNDIGWASAVFNEIIENREKEDQIERREREEKEEREQKEREQREREERLRIEKAALDFAYQFVTSRNDNYDDNKSFSQSYENAKDNINKRY